MPGNRRANRGAVRRTQFVGAWGDHRQQIIHAGASHTLSTASLAVGGDLVAVFAEHFSAPTAGVAVCYFAGNQDPVLFPCVPCKDDNMTSPPSEYDPAVSVPHD